MLDGTKCGAAQQHDGAAARQARERLIELYVVRPVNLPQEPDNMFAADEANASCLAWLCPACMAVMVRRPAEEETVRGCPYCAVQNGTNECS
ncbi:hypothetical protein DQ04_07001000 [Trypanosoma grayi]|uniref:hypothetical protein n=1 Tax=Trypanosoma grayi TaxID=71804 RepID=UPI0004F3F0F3|nr:hypothetical protein DQ04_07001000 [Trypanosoma grayi]KEG08515.1 hypothetical protein DQ04_07001000 [Trypanosoma grayi]